MQNKEKKIFYRYKLVSDYPENSISFKGIHLNKTYKDFSSLQGTLMSDIRTKQNPEGIIDYVMYDANSKEVIFDSFQYFNAEPKKYTYEEFCHMSRKALEGISNVYGLPTKNAVNAILIKRIIKEQDMYFSPNAIKERKEKAEKAKEAEKAMSTINNQANIQA